MTELTESEDRKDLLQATEALSRWFESQGLDGGRAGLVCIEFLATISTLGAKDWPQLRDVLHYAGARLIDSASHKFLRQELTKLHELHRKMKSKE